MSTNLPQQTQPVAHLSGNLLEASTDLEVLATFLREQQSEATRKNYEKEIKRFGTWLGNKGKTFFQCSRGDLSDYESYLRNPPAIDVGKPGSGKPFVSHGLSDDSISVAFAALRSAYKYALDNAYLHASPFQTYSTKQVKRQKTHVERFLNSDQWEALCFYIQQLPEKTDAEKRKKVRLDYVFTLAYVCALRSSDFINNGMADFYCIKRPTGDQWWLRLLGKGNKEGNIPVPDTAMKKVFAYRQSLGLPSSPKNDENNPLLLSITGKSSVKYGALYKLVKTTLKAVAALLNERGDSELAEQVLLASTHWIRHTSLTHYMESGVDTRSGARLARHTDLSTIEKYIHLDKDNWHDEMSRAAKGS